MAQTTCLGVVWTGLIGVSGGGGVEYGVVVVTGEVAGQKKYGIRPDDTFGRRLGLFDKVGMSGGGRRQARGGSGHWLQGSTEHFASGLKYTYKFLTQLTF